MNIQFIVNNDQYYDLDVRCAWQVLHWRQWVELLQETLQLFPHSNNGITRDRP